jgi:predicted nucleotidyltransferase
MEVVEERRRLREKAVGVASNWARKLPFKATVILIGSYARGDFNLWSDIDVLLISEDFKGGPVGRLKSLDMPPNFQIIPLTPSEFQRLLMKKNPLAVEAIKSGIILRNDLKFITSTRGGE